MSGISRVNAVKQQAIEACQPFVEAIVRARNSGRHTIVFDDHSKETIVELPHETKAMIERCEEHIQYIMGKANAEMERIVSAANYAVTK